jgi:hypothetical protein
MTHAAVVLGEGATFVGASVVVSGMVVDGAVVKQYCSAEMSLQVDFLLSEYARLMNVIAYTAG